MKIKMDFLSEARTDFRELAQKIRRAEVGSEQFFKTLEKLIELNIEIKGHAWCMDVRSERRRMARLTTGLLKNI